MLVPINCSKIVSTNVSEVITGGYVIWRYIRMREGGDNMSPQRNTAFTHTRLKGRSFLVAGFGLLLDIRYFIKVGNAPITLRLKTKIVLEETQI